MKISNVRVIKPTQFPFGFVQNTIPDTLECTWEDNAGFIMVKSSGGTVCVSAHLIGSFVVEDSGPKKQTKVKSQKEIEKAFG